MKTVNMRWVMLGVLIAGVAQAKGLMVAEQSLAPEVRESLAKQIALGKGSDPEAFGLIQSLPKATESLDRKKRGKIAPVTPVLKGLGQRASLPLIELLAFNAPDISAMTESAKLALFSGALETLGNLRDARAEPVLLAIVESPETGKDILHIAAAALGRQDSDLAVQTLLALSTGDSVKRNAAYYGLGNCRRAASAAALASFLPETKDLAEYKIVAKMLGRIGNAWAWETGKVGRIDEQARVRELAARALIAGHLAAVHPEALEATTKALLVVDAPMTPSLLIEAREGASGERLQRLAALSERFERSRR